MHVMCPLLYACIHAHDYPTSVLQDIRMKFMDLTMKMMVTNQTKVPQPPMPCRDGAMAERIAMCKSMSSVYITISRNWLMNGLRSIYISNGFCCHFARDMTDSTEAPPKELKNKLEIDRYIRYACGTRGGHFWHCFSQFSHAQPSTSKPHEPGAAAAPRGMAGVRGWCGNPQQFENLVSAREQGNFFTAIRFIYMLGAKCHEHLWS